MPCLTRYPGGPLFNVANQALLRTNSSSSDPYNDIPTPRALHIVGIRFDIRLGVVRGGNLRGGRSRQAGRCLVDRWSE